MLNKYYARIALTSMFFLLSISSNVCYADKIIPVTLKPNQQQLFKVKNIHGDDAKITIRIKDYQINGKSVYDIKNIGSNIKVTCALIDEGVVDNSGETQEINKNDPECAGNAANNNDGLAVTVQNNPQNVEVVVEVQTEDCDLITDSLDSDNIYTTLKKIDSSKNEQVLEVINKINQFKTDHGYLPQDLETMKKDLQQIMVDNERTAYNNMGIAQLKQNINQRTEDITNFIFARLNGQK